MATSLAVAIIRNCLDSLAPRAAYRLLKVSAEEMTMNNSNRKSVKRLPRVLEARDLMKATGGAPSGASPSFPRSALGFVPEGHAPRPALGFVPEGPKRPHRPLLGFVPTK